MNGAAKKPVQHMAEVAALPQGGYGLSVAGRALTTPQKQALVVPTRALAEHMAQEWNAAKGLFKPDAMLATTLAYTAIDRITPAKEQVVDALMEYLHTDTLCYWSPDPQVQAHQRSDWLPVIEWANKRYGLALHYGDALINKPQNEADFAKVKAMLMTLEPMEISALGALVPAYGSLILALCVKEGVTDALAAYRLSSLESELQAERWGRDAEAVEKSARIRREVESIEHFLKVLHDVKTTPQQH